MERRLIIARCLGGMLAPFMVLALIVSAMGHPTKDSTPSDNGKVITKVMIITGYSIDRRQCGKSDGITATGRNGKKFSGVAADFTLFPKGTRINIPGVGERIVDDTGGAMRQDWRKRGVIHVDLRFIGRDAKKRAVAWGRKKLEVTILPPVS